MAISIGKVANLLDNDSGAIRVPESAINFDAVRRLREAEWARTKAGRLFPVPVDGDLGWATQMEDFLASPGATLPSPWADGHTGTTPTHDYGADAKNGTFVLKLATATEAEVAYLSHGDQRMYPITQKPVIQFYAKIEPDVAGAGGVFGAGDKLVMGLASDLNATIDSVAEHAWFMLAGANMNVYLESDDGTHDTDDKDSGVDYVANTLYLFEIDCRDLADVRFRINGVDVNNGNTFNIHHATGNVQPYFYLTKASAANKDHRVTIDLVKTIALRCV